MSVLPVTPIAVVVFDQVVAVLDDAVAAAVEPPVSVMPVGAVAVTADVAADEGVRDAVDQLFDEDAVVGFGGRNGGERQQGRAGSENQMAAGNHSRLPLV